MTSFNDSRLPKRFWDKLALVGECWQWHGCKTGHGYGQIWYGGKVSYPHIVAYETFVGPVSVGLELDHLCRNPACCNPAHLEPVTHRENVARGKAGEARGAQQRAKTHCPSGHEYAGENLYLYRGVHRYCRACLARRTREARAAKAV